MSMTAVQSGDRPAKTALRFGSRPRWTWTSVGVTAGAILTAIGFPLKGTFGGMLLEFVGFLVVLVTLVAFLIVGPEQDAGS